MTEHFEALISMLESCSLHVGDPEQAMAAAELRRQHDALQSTLAQNNELDQKLAQLERINQELLEALKQCDEAMMWELGGEPLPMLMVEARKKARAVIAKAQGEQA